MSVLKEEVLRIDNGEPLQFFINRLPHAGIMVDEHWHDYYEILYIADGLSLQSINRQTRQTQPGDIVIVAPGDIHATKAISETGCMIFVLIFYPSALNFENVSSGGSARLDAFLNRSCLHSGYVSSPYVHGKELSRLFSKMNEECTLQQPGHKLIVKGLIYEVLGYLSRIGETVQPKTAGDAKFQKIAQVCCFIEERYREAPSLSAAAAHFGYSPEYLSRLFRETTGTTYKSYLDYIRIGEARRLLHYEHKTVGETSELLGYTSLTSFHRAFKRVCGIPPSHASLYLPPEPAAMPGEIPHI